MNRLICILSASTFLVLLSFSASSQSPTKVMLWGSKVLPYLSKFTDECKREEYMPNGMGIISIMRTKPSADSVVRWYLSVMLDDRYKDAPPAEYAQVGQTIYFFYDQKTSDVSPSSVSPQIIAQLSELMADRVYIRPSSQQRWSEYSVKGKIIRDTIRKDLVGGYPRNTIVLIFHPNGEISTSRPFRE
jgi:hypothetical protein